MSLELEEKYFKTVNDFKDINFDGLSIPQKIERINSLVLSFPSVRKHDLCRFCRASHGDLKEYSPNIEDGGTCSSCFKGHDVLHYSIVELVEKANLSPHDFYSYTDEETNITYNGLRKSFDHEEIFRIMREKSKG